MIRDCHSLALPGAERLKSSAVALPGLPQHIALQCLARVPASSLWDVCRDWQYLLYHCPYFLSLRLRYGLGPLHWIYSLVHLHNQHYMWYAYDPLAATWHTLPHIPHTVDFQLTNAGLLGLSHSVQCASTTTKLIMVAGLQLKKQGTQLEPALDCPLIFDTMTGEWTKGAPFRVPRKWCACGTIGEKLLVIGGCGKGWDMGLSKSVEMYDTDNNTWCIMDDLKSSKFNGEAIRAVSVGGNLHMVTGESVFWKVGAILNGKTGKWEEMPPGMRKGWTGDCVVIEGKLFVLDECDYVGRLKVYDQEEDAWRIYMEDEALKGMRHLVRAEDNIICGMVRAGQDNAVTRFMDISKDRNVGMRSYDVKPPQGKVIAIHVLPRMDRTK